MTPWKANSPGASLWPGPQPPAQPLLSILGRLQDPRASSWPGDTEGQSPGFALGEGSTWPGLWLCSGFSEPSAQARASGLPAALSPSYLEQPILPRTPGPHWSPLPIGGGSVRTVPAERGGATCAHRTLRTSQLSAPLPANCPKVTPPQPRPDGLETVFGEMPFSAAG